MKTVFKACVNNNVMGFDHEGLKGGFYLTGSPILATLNGPYPIRNLSEKEALEKVRAITDDFLEVTGTKEGLITWVYKLILEGECIIYSVNINAATREVAVTHQNLKDVLDSFLPQQVKGGEEVDGFFIKSDGKKVWAFQPVEHFLLCLVPDEQYSSINVRVYQADSTVAELIEHDHHELLEFFMNKVLPKISERYPQLSPMNQAKNTDPEKLFEELVSLLENPEMRMPKREVTLELTGQPPVTLKLSHLFGFRAIKDGEKTSEHLTIYHDGQHFLLYTVTPSEDGSKPPMMTLEQITPEQIVDLARRMVWGQSQADEVLRTQKWIN